MESSSPTRGELSRGGIDGRAAGGRSTRQSGEYVAGKVHIACVCLQRGRHHSLCRRISVLDDGSDARLRRTSSCARVLSIPYRTWTRSVPESGRRAACDVEGRRA